MTVKQTDTGKWLLQIDRKNAPRIRKQFDSEDDAKAFERQYLAEHLAKPLQAAARDSRTLLDLILLWHKYHGINLSDHERRKRCLIEMAKCLGNPVASQLSPEEFVLFRYAKLTEGICEKSMNNRHGYLCAVYNKLAKLKVIDYKNPIGEVDFIKLHERQLSYLSPTQIKILLDEMGMRRIMLKSRFHELSGSCRNSAP